MTSPDQNGSRPSLPWETPAMPTPPAASAPVPEPPTKPRRVERSAMSEIKSRIHRRLLERLNLSNLDKLEQEQVIDAIRRVTHDLLQQESVPLNFEERERLVGQVLDEIFGLGPLEPLIQDPDVSDILVNTWRHVYIERAGKLEPTDVRFQDDRHLLQ